MALAERLRRKSDLVSLAGIEPAGSTRYPLRYRDNCWWASACIAIDGMELQVSYKDAEL